MTHIQAKLPHSKQSGFILIVCLVILLVLTVIGVGTMSTANLEERMASNSQSMLTMFQHAESGIAAALADQPTLLAVGQTLAAVQLTHTLGNDTVTTDIAPPPDIEQVNLVGYSFNISGYPVEIFASAESAGSGARSRLAQGIAVKAPSENTVN